MVKRIGLSTYEAKAPLEMGALGQRDRLQDSGPGPCSSFAGALAQDNKTPVLISHGLRQEPAGRSTAFETVA